MEIDVLAYLGLFFSLKWRIIGLNCKLGVIKAALELDAKPISKLAPDHFQ